ncbi:MAG: transposase [Flavobacteriales bacterium Tduv]
MLRNTTQISFSELYMERSAKKSEFLKRLKIFINWEGMEKEIIKIYQKGQGIKDQPAHSGIALFKMMLLSQSYDLSDLGTEKLVKETLSFMRFSGFRLEYQIPNHTTLCRFHNEIIAKKAYERLLKKINKELGKLSGNS